MELAQGEKCNMGQRIDQDKVPIISRCAREVAAVLVFTYAPYTTESNGEKNETHLEI